MTETILRRTLKITLYVGIFFFVIFSVMTMLGGKSDGYRNAVEAFLGGTFGGHAEIGTFEGITFFPSLSLKAENIRLLNADKKPVGRVGILDVKLSFWDVLFSNGRMQRLNVRDVALSEEITGHGPVAVTRAAILQNEQEGADTEYYFKSEGVWGNDPFSVYMEMERYGSAENPTFAFGQSRVLSAQLGDFALSVTMMDGSGSSTFIKDLNVTEKDRVLLRGDGELKDGLWGPVTLTGSFKTALGSLIEPRIAFHEKDGSVHYKGDLVLKDFTMADLGGDAGVRNAIDRLLQIIDPPEPEVPFALPQEHIDVRVTIESWQDYHGALSVPIRLEDRILTVDFQGGEFAHGTILGDVVMDNSAITHTELRTDLRIKNADLDAFLMGREGPKSGYLSLTMEGMGERMEDVLASAAGSFSFMASGNMMDTGALDLWGGGLVSAILPDGKPEYENRLNCAISQATIEKGVANFSDILVDTARVSILGTGEYDIAEDSLDIRLKPESKGLALGTLNSAVNVRGSLGAPSASPDLGSLGAKLGGLLLGAVNPAVWAFSFADLGINDAHPCAPFLQEKKQEAE